MSPFVVLFLDDGSGGFEAKADGFNPVVVWSERVGGQPNLHAERDGVRSRVAIDDVAAHRCAATVDDGRNERNRYPGSGEGDDRE